MQQGDSLVFKDDDGNPETVWYVNAPAAQGLELNQQDQDPDPCQVGEQVETPDHVAQDSARHH